MIYYKNVYNTIINSNPNDSLQTICSKFSTILISVPFITNQYTSYSYKTQKYSIVDKKMQEVDKKL